MEVPKGILKKWIGLKSPGDAAQIVSTMTDGNRVSDETIRRVFKEGKCSDEVFKAMADFYEKKAEIISQYL